MSGWHITLAARVLRASGIVAYPTEAVYGLGCNPRDEVAVRRLLAIKRRPIEKGLILIAADVSQLEPYIDLDALTSAQRGAIAATWPGPATWTVPARPHTPVWLRGRHATLAVRVTAHPAARALCLRSGMALVSTSANVSGHPPARDALNVRKQLGRELDFIVPGQTGGLSKPTTIRDARSGALLRAG